MSGHAVTRECRGRKSMAWGRGRAGGGIAWWKSLLGRINGSSNTRMPTPEPGKTARTTYTLPAWQWGGPAAPNECAQSDATAWDDLLMYDKQGWWQNEASSPFSTLSAGRISWQFNKAAEIQAGINSSVSPREDFRFRVVYLSRFFFLLSFLTLSNINFERVWTHVDERVLRGVHALNTK